MSEPWVEKTRRADGIEQFEFHFGGNIYVFSLEVGEKIAREILGLLGIDVAQLEEESELYKQRIVFEQACRFADAQHDYTTAAYVLRDLPLTQGAELANLAHAMHEAGCSKGDWDGLRDLWDKAYRKAIGGE